MKKITELVIPSCEDRVNLCGILAVAGYCVTTEEIDTDISYRKKYVVIVYEKQEAIDDRS